MLHDVDQVVEHRDGIVDDLGAALARAVKQPLRDLQFGVQHRSLLDLSVAGSAGRVVGIEDDIGRFARARAEHPEQIAGWIADPERVPVDDPGDLIALMEHRIGAHRPVDDGRRELPERWILAGVLPPVDERGGHEACRLGVFHDGAGNREGVERTHDGKPCIRHEAGRQRVDRGHGPPNRRGESVARRDAREFNGRAREKVVHDRAGSADRSLAHERMHRERQAGSDAPAQRGESGELSGGLRLRCLHPRQADEKAASVARLEHRLFETAEGSRPEP